MSLLEHYGRDLMKRIFLLHCQKDDVMFLFQKNILATTIKLPQEIYHLNEGGGRKTILFLNSLLGISRMRDSFLFLSGIR